MIGDGIILGARTGGAIVRHSRLLTCFFGGPVGGLLARPAFDRAILRYILRIHFPLSRAWAAAVGADGSIARFRQSLGLNGGPGERVLTPIFERIGRKQVALETAEEQWLEAFFADRRTAPEQLIALEKKRLKSSRAFVDQSWLFARSHMLQPFPRARWEIPDHATVEARYGELAEEGQTAHRIPETMPDVMAAAPSPAEYGELRWLRFRAPVSDVGEWAWARMYTPRGVKSPPTILIAHGIGVESDHWDYPYDPFDELVREGICVVRMEAPWHGRRREKGYAAGEPIFARAPLGVINFCEAYLKEFAVLTTWLRERNGGPVGIVGISIGGIVSQLAATAARNWPREARPDALAVISSTRSMASALHRGSLAHGIGMPDELNARNWGYHQLARWRPLIEPYGDPVMPSEKIIMALGIHDDVTPFKQALALAGRWNVPDDNLFVRNQGHFSLVSGLFRDKAPLRRLRQVLEA